MSNRPNPVALTSAMLMGSVHRDNVQEMLGLRIDGYLSENDFRHPDPVECAQLASAIHRLAPACKRLAEAECNGEWHDGQRQKLYGPDGWSKANLQRLDDSIESYATRLDKRIAKLNTQLAPFGYQLVRQGDPRGATLVMAETPVNDSATHYAIG